MCNNLHSNIKGRGSSDNPVNRFEGNYIDYDLDDETGEKPSPKTKLFADHAKEIISFNKSPDIPFNAGINVYRGCEHGCIYCYARPFHEYLGFSVGLDFETKIMVKYEAADLLKKKFQSPKWKPQVVAMSGVTDCYQPIERKLLITRKCLEVFAEFRNPVGIITKNHLITRDIDLLKELNEYNCVSTTISITSLDNKITEVMEPRTSRPYRRLKAIEKLANAGIPVGVNVAPIIPGLTDHECADILKSAADAGATRASYIIVRLPFKVKDLFQDWLEQHFPDRKEKVLNKIRDIRGGELYEAEFGKRMRGEGNYAIQIKDLFFVQSKKLGLNKKYVELDVSNFKSSIGEQLHLFT
ncbi:MAG: PA0069 family radical SAM protein [Balneola sp.]